MKSYDSPLVTKPKGLNFRLGKSGRKKNPFFKRGLCSRLPLIQLREEKILWEKIHEIFKKHGSAPSYYDQKDLEVLWKLHIIHKVGFFIY